MNESSGPPQSVNPYAPSVQLDLDPVDAVMPGDDSWLSAGKIILATIAAVTASGGLFGLLVAGAYVVAIGLSTDQLETSVALASLVYAVPLSLISGLLVAGLASSIVVPLCFWLFGKSDRFRGGDWNRKSLRNFGVLCGFSSGWICIVCLGGMSPIGALLGLIPGGFSALVTPTLVRRLLRGPTPIANHT